MIFPLKLKRLTISLSILAIFLLSSMVSAKPTSIDQKIRYKPHMETNRICKDKKYRDVDFKALSDQIQRLGQLIAQQEE